MKFPYAQYQVEPTPSDPGVTVIYRPVIPFRASSDAAGTVFYGLLDSGADETMLTRALAEAAGIVADTSQTSVAMSASGEIPVVYGRATLEVGRGKERFRWKTTVGIVDQPWQEAILGRRGFLQFFDVTFRGGKQEIILKRNRVPFPKA